MTLAEALRILKEANSEAAGAVEHAISEAKVSQSAEITELKARLDEREKIKKIANDEAADERHKRKALEGKLKTLEKLGIVTKEFELAIPEEQLKETTAKLAELEQLKAKVQEFENVTKSQKRAAFVTDWTKEKGYTSGVKVLLDYVERQGDKINVEEKEAAGKLLEGVVKEFGEEIFKISSTPAPAAGANGNPPQPTPGNPGGFHVHQGGGGSPAEISAHRGRPGTPPEKAPTVADLAIRVRGENRLPIPANVSAVADAEKQKREGQQRVPSQQPSGTGQVDVTGASRQ